MSLHTSYGTQHYTADVELTDYTQIAGATIKRICEIEHQLLGQYGHSRCATYTLNKHSATSTRRYEITHWPQGRTWKRHTHYLPAAHPVKGVTSMRGCQITHRYKDHNDNIPHTTYGLYTRSEAQSAQKVIRLYTGKADEQSDRRHTTHKLKMRSKTHDWHKLV